MTVPVVVVFDRDTVANLVVAAYSPCVAPDGEAAELMMDDYGVPTLYARPTSVR